LSLLHYITLLSNGSKYSQNILRWRYENPRRLPSEDERRDEKTV